MKKVYPRILFAALLLILLTFGFWFYYNAYRFHRSNNYIKLNTSLLLNDKELPNWRGKSEILYIGRSTCPECQRFKPKLSKILSKDHKFAYYYDTDQNRNNFGFKKIIHKYHVKEVPTLVIITKSKELKMEISNPQDLNKVSKMVNSVE